MQIKEGKKDHQHAYAYAHKIKPTLDLMVWTSLLKRFFK
jgi:hypothetical protein